MNQKNITGVLFIILLDVIILLNLSCHHKSTIVMAVFETEETAHDSDDPAIWINKINPEESLVLGTDKHTNGSLYVFDLRGKIIWEKTIPNLRRPNNVDIAYSVKLGEEEIDIAVVTERGRNQIRIFALPSMEPVDNGGIPVFEDEVEKAPMGIGLYTRLTDSTTFAIVSRKKGPQENYLWQYQISDDGNGKFTGILVRKFGNYSGKKEIESVAVDNELGFIYYSDEMHGIHKYYADPKKGNKELALFGTNDFKRDIEGISIYKTGPENGYLIISNQQADQMMVYRREGSVHDIHEHTLITALDFDTRASDGSDVTNVNLGPEFPAGLFVAMSEGRIFKYFDWRNIQRLIE